MKRLQPSHHVSAETFLQNVVTFTQVAGSLHVGERFESCTGRFFRVSGKSDFYVNAVGSDGVEQFANCARVRPVGEK